MAGAHIHLQAIWNFRSCMGIAGVLNDTTFNTIRTTWFTQGFDFIDIVQGIGGLEDLFVIRGFPKDKKQYMTGFFTKIAIVSATSPLKTLLVMLI